MNNGSGKWIYRDVEQHRCEKPPYDNTIKRGDRWQCGCGKIWCVASIDGGPQWDYYDTPALVWEEEV